MKIHKLFPQDFNEMYTKMFGTAPIIENQDDKKRRTKSCRYNKR